MGAYARPGDLLSMSLGLAIDADGAYRGYHPDWIALGLDSLNPCGPTKETGGRW